MRLQLYLSSWRMARTVLCWTLLSIALTAQDRVRIGVLPFDVASVDGGSSAAASALAKLVRAQLITNRRAQPVLLDVPDGATLPLSDKQIAEAAEKSDVDYVISATVLEATTTRGSNRISTGSFGGVIGSSVGASLSRVKAEVGMQVELARRDGTVADSFEVKGDETDMGVGTDIWTAIGSFDVGDAGWDRSPMGKALREAAEKLATEAIKRARPVK